MGAVHISQSAGAMANGVWPSCRFWKHFLVEDTLCCLWWAAHKISGGVGLIVKGK